ncbi:MAG: DUF2330 domain-containing protein [Chloroflexota bacterium]|nr:MAG: DUF2330 domain-containing protein [Chloroflexota bacterium]TMD86028.1 MAG: DUF2330 domain-containing protein [Chloroflexota bacterium]
MVNKLVPAAAATLALFLTQALPAAACGGLIAPNGAIRLERATTLVAWHDGVERYMTSFSYSGEASSFGWIVPLPAVPQKVEEGGGWTLQRLVRETHPQPPILALDFAASRTQAASAEVLQQVQVRALDITVLRGSGQAVLDWASENGFAVDAETRAHVLQYAKGSPIFMAAKYNAGRAQQQRLLFGDGAPVLITMKIPHPWVPFEVLAAGQQVQADLYLLSDKPVNTSEWRALIGASGVGTKVQGAEGFSLEFQEKMTDGLYKDLSTDKNMGWVRRDSWLTYLTLNAPDDKVTYDLSVTPMGVVKVAPFGTEPMAIVDGNTAATKPLDAPTAPMGTATTLLVLGLVIGAAAWILRPRKA